MTRTLSVVQRVHGYPLFLRQQMEVSIINKKVIPNNVNDDLVNEKIRFKEVMVIDKDGTKLGIKLRREALDIAYNPAGM